MSTYWDIKCRTCNVKAGAYNQNHAESQMWDIIKHAAAIAAAAPVLAAFGCTDGLDIGVGWRPDAEWFVKHLGHDLVPVNEYGEESGQCSGQVVCDSCGTHHNCKADRGHAGPHRHKQLRPEEVKRIHDLCFDEKGYSFRGHIYSDHRCQRCGKTE